jgi:AraC-like DNA-binding protein
MIYHRQTPSPATAHLVNCYWHIDSEGNTEVATQKIVPDGYPEIILHYGDAYEINLTGEWQLQGSYLLAGQLRSYFHLRNTGRSGMIGIKLQPSALTHLLGIDQSKLSGSVVALPDEIQSTMATVISMLKPDLDSKVIFEKLDEIFENLATQAATDARPIDKAIALVIEKHGNLGLDALTAATQCSERQLERLFQRFVGLTPKFYCRIVRLAYIFELMQEGDKSWSDLVYDSGFYDQSHFIKNFKEFTGEDPSSYGFEERNMANFHLKK